MVINNKIKISSKIKAPIDTYTANTVCATLLMLQRVFKLLTLSTMLTLLHCLHCLNGFYCYTACTVHRYIYIAIWLEGYGNMALWAPELLGLQHSKDFGRHEIINFGIINVIIITIIINPIIIIVIIIIINIIITPQ